MTVQDIQIAAAVTYQRADGRLDIGVDRAERGVTRLVRARQQGSFRTIFPTVARDVVEAVILNTAGGVTGGDRFEVIATADTGSNLTLTTQAAERIYCAVHGQTGQVRNVIDVGCGARVDWLPQETIVFDGARLQRRLDVALAANAQFLMVEPVAFGRIASGETVTSGLFHDSISIRRAGHLIYRDGLRMAGNIAATLNRPAVANGAMAMANVVFHHPDAGGYLTTIRPMLPATAGASLLSDGLLVMRVVAADSFVLRQTLVPVLNALTNDNMPKNWRL